MANNTVTPPTTEQLQSLLFSKEAELETFRKQLQELDAGPKVASISEVKLPEFILSNPQLWIQMCESSFNTYHPVIKLDRTKYDHLVKRLNYRVLEEISDVTTSQEYSYEKLKAALIHRFSESTETRFARLLQGEELGDNKPSQLLRRLRALSTGDNAVSEKLLNKLWMQRLPKNVRQVLQVSTATLTEMAQLADKIVEVEKGQLSEVSTYTPSINDQLMSNPSESNIMEVFKKFTAELSELRKRFDSQQGNRSRSHSRGRSRASSRVSSVNHDFCWYHNRFGADARKCVQPCKWKGETKN